MERPFYQDPTTLEFLDSLIKKGVLELKPTLDKSGIRYEDAENALGVSAPAEVGEFLEMLAEQGVLEKRFLDRVIFCPACKSPDIRSRYTCKRCRSPNVGRTELLEHVKCGYMGSRKEFTKGSSLICPQCNVEMVERDVDFRVIGECYECEECGHRFDSPNVVHFCPQCQKAFTHRDAVYTKLVAYRISEDVMKQIGAGVPYLETIGRVLREHRFETRFRETIQGSSGIPHGFDIIAERDDIRLVIDVSHEGREEDLFHLLGKQIDIQPTASILVVMSNSEAISSLSKVYDVSVISAESEEDLQTNLKAFLDALFISTIDRSTNKPHQK